jgi:endonuclease-3
LTIDIGILKSLVADAGLSNQKAPRFVQIAHSLKESFGAVTLKPLRSYSDPDAEKFLTSLAGVGVKTAKCVLMYSMGRKVLPVDTHVARISRRLGLVDDNLSATYLHGQLEKIIVPSLRYDFHVNAIAHALRERFEHLCGLSA